MNALTTQAPYAALTNQQLAPTPPTAAAKLAVSILLLNLRYNLSTSLLSSCIPIEALQTGQCGAVVCDSSQWRRQSGWEERVQEQTWTRGRDDSEASS